jgi:hypothetical protein
MTTLRKDASDDEASVTDVEEFSDREQQVRRH